MRSWVRLGAVAVAVLVLGGLAPAAGAQLVPPVGLPIPPIALTSEPTALGRLDRQHPLLTFSGGVENPTPFPLANLPVPVVCEATCQQFAFTAARRTPFLVSIKDKAGSQNNGWDLYVYGPSGDLVGAANGVGANGQAIAVTAPRRGSYRVYVTFTYAYDTSAAYAGEVRLMTGTTWQPAAPVCRGGAGRRCFNLPVLFAEPPSDLHVNGLPPAASTPLGFPIPVAFPTDNSCYVDETVQLGASRCLRFTSNVKNVGGGLLDLRLTYSGTGCVAEQILHGARRKATRTAGPCEFHPAHAHFHYKDFVGFALHELNGDGTLGDEVGSGLKESFCLADDDYFGFGSAGPNGPRDYAGQPGCSVPANVSPNGAVLEEGLTPGWGDVYTWDTPGQVIDITDLAPGRYALVERTNPAESMLVAGPQQTCSRTDLTLTATNVTATASHAVVACPE
ncbi:MAG: hypothetical protein H0W70_14715 [Actinobacteria bacterium]|nr:hypothetical protein [Actinomycetota bacterium]